ncbi:MAG: superoxide dismutase, Cu-Zn family, partial [Actinomycetota bacterium]|nr:superoxide dismutase, Cu-Zn family [Actinomycetota bacterium]
GPAQVTGGVLRPFAAGTGSAVGGQAQMVRTAGESTIVSLHVEGLTAGGQYASHVHAAACAVGDADGHYKLDPAGAAAPPNEIWLAGGTFVANDAGIANVRAVASYTAGAGAVSVVVHDLSLPSTANKIACADLG